MMQTLLPENPLRNPKSDESYPSYNNELKSWVLDEAVAAYTGTESSLQAAIETYKRNFFLAVSEPHANNTCSKYTGCLCTCRMANICQHRMVHKCILFVDHACTKLSNWYQSAPQIERLAKS